jgi:gliotoxin/aspirochlorine biosynthesis aminotransferase
MLTAYTGGFVDLLGIKRGTNMSSYTQLWLAFTLSGIFHALSQLMAPSPTNITFEERTVGIFLFFLWQAAAITIEDFVHWLWKQGGGSFAKRSVLRTAVGYAWVLFSMWYSIPLAGDVFLRRRFGVESPLPFTIWGTVMEHFPLPSNHA